MYHTHTYTHILTHMHLYIYIYIYKGKKNLFREAKKQAEGRDGLCQKGVVIGRVKIAGCWVRAQPTAVLLPTSLPIY